MLAKREGVYRFTSNYYHDADCFIFASEIKAILMHSRVPRVVHRSVIPLYLTYGYVPTPYTLFEGIYELRPGHSLTLRDGQDTVCEYWREMLLDAQALRHGYFNEATVRRLIDEHQSGKSAHSHRLWALLTFEVWHRMFINAPEVCTPH